MTLDDRAPAVDAAVLVRLAEEVGGVEEVVELYLRALPLRCASIAHALAAGDAVTLRQTAHTLQSASAFVGAMPLAALCARLEEASQRSQLPVGVGEEVAEEARRVERELRALLATHPFG